jgi:hypothetical protein
VACFRQLRAGFSCKFLHSDRGVGAAGRPVCRNDKNIRTWYLTLARSALYFLDTLQLWRALLRAGTDQPDVILCDRYVYDELATLLGGSVAERYVRLMLHLVPPPDVAYLLDAEPEEARLRKPEYPLSFLHQYRLSFLRLCEFAGLTRISPMSAEKMHEAIWERLTGESLPKQNRDCAQTRVADGEGRPHAEAPSQATEFLPCPGLEQGD